MDPHAHLPHRGKSDVCHRISLYISHESSITLDVATCPGIVLGSDTPHIRLPAINITLHAGLGGNLDEPPLGNIFEVFSCRG